MAVKIFVFTKLLREEVVADSEEQARCALTWPNEEWTLEDVREVPA